MVSYLEKADDTATAEAVPLLSMDETSVRRRQRQSRSAIAGIVSETGGVFEKECLICHSLRTHVQHNSIFYLMEITNIVVTLHATVLSSVRYIINNGTSVGRRILFHKRVFHSE